MLTFLGVFFILLVVIFGGRNFIMKEDRNPVNIENISEADSSKSYIADGHLPEEHYEATTADPTATASGTGAALFINVNDQVKIEEKIDANII
jgi:hypothetical protein